MKPKKEVTIIGAGPAGLTAAYYGVRHGLKPVVVEQRDKVGGIASTEEYKGFLFDMGGHRFFSAHPKVCAIWHDILDKDFLTRSRLSRIYYKGKFFDYPLRGWNALRNIDIFTAFCFLASYLRWHLFPYRKEETFEQWVTNRFGRQLFNAFFKSYTEKVWGISCSELRAEWAAQRIKNLTLRKTLTSMFTASGNKVRTLIDSFQYPRCGPGMMWNAAKEDVEKAGGVVHLNTKVDRLIHEDSRIVSLVISNGEKEQTLPVDELVSSMPLTTFVQRIHPAPPAPVLAAAERLQYRAFVTVCLIVDRPDLFPDQWLYIHEPDVRMGRIQNYRNWSPDMVPDSSRTGIGIEYFCNEGDDLWSMADDDLLALARDELAMMNLAKAGEVTDGVVYRVPKAYPVYDESFKEHLGTIREFMETLENVQTIGRNGQFRYNNMDHSMLTALYAVDNITGAWERKIWSVNEEKEYIEEAPDEEVLDEAGSHPPVFHKVNRFSMACALSLLCGAGLLIITLCLVSMELPLDGSFMEHIAPFLPGYSLSFLGGILGVLLGLVYGFVIGWIGAALWNMLIVAGWIAFRFNERRAHLKRLLDYI